MLSSLFGAAEGVLLTFLVNSSPATYYSYEIHRLLFLSVGVSHMMFSTDIVDKQNRHRTEGMDIMDIQTLLLIIIVVLLLGGGGC